MSQLTTQHTRLRSLEIVIEEGKQTFIDVGNALAEIKEQELYKLTHSTFADYCKERWGFNKAYANHVIRAAELVSSLPAGAATIVATETQARELQKVEACKRVEVLEKAQAIAESENRALTAKDITNASPAKQKPSPAYVAPVEPDEPEPATAPAKLPVMPAAKPFIISAYPVPQCLEELNGTLEIVLADYSIEDLRKVSTQLDIMQRRISSRIAALKTATLNS